MAFLNILSEPPLLRMAQGRWFWKSSTCQLGFFIVYIHKYCQRVFLSRGNIFRIHQSTSRVSLLTTHYSLLTTHYSLLTSCQFLLTTSHKVRLQENMVMTARSQHWSVKPMMTRPVAKSKRLIRDIWVRRTRSM